MARRGSARQVEAGHGRAWHGSVGLVKVDSVIGDGGGIFLYKVRQGVARQVLVRHGPARRCKAWQGFFTKDIKLDNYHSDTSCISKTMLNLFCNSPLEYHLTYHTGELAHKVSTAAMDFGTVMHAVLLEGKQLSELVQVYPDDCYKSNGARNPVPCRKFESEIYPAIAVKPDFLAKVQRCVESLKDSLLMEAIEQSTHCEKRFDAEVWGVDCKCKPDILCDMGDHVLICDLKFCDPSPDAFRRSAKRFRYWLQDAHYSTVVANVFQKPVQFRFFAVEPDFPFRVSCQWYDEISRTLAKDYHKRKLEQLIECEKTGDWSDKWESVMTISPWDLEDTSEDQELEGFEDDATIASF